MATVGKTTDGTQSSTSSGDKIAVSSATAAETGTLTSGTARAWLTSATSTPTKMLVFADSAGNPGSLLAESDEVTISQTTEGPVNYTFSGGDQITITSGVTYWIGLYWKDPDTAGTTGVINFSRDSIAAGRQETSAVTYPTAPASFGTGTVLTGPIDAYLTFTVGGSGGTGMITARTPTVAGASAASVAADMSTAQVGDFALLTVAADAPITAPTGWTAAFTQINQTVDFAAYYRVLTGAGADSPTVTATSATRITAIVQPFTGVDTSTPLDATPVTTNGSSTLTLSITGLTTVTANALAIAGAAIDATNNTYDMTVSGTGWSEVVQTLGTGRRQEIAHKAMATPGATGTVTFTQSGGALWMVGFQLALRPAPGSGGGGTGNTTRFLIAAAV